jgi:hypothetical protein
MSMGSELYKEDRVLYELYDLKNPHFCLSVLIFFVRLSVFCCNIRKDIRGCTDGNGSSALPRPSWLWVVWYRLCLYQETVNRRKPNTNVCVCVCAEGFWKGAGRDGGRSDHAEW